jgi:4-hydroxythreonine-4-phosphate dehydrogenase
MHESTKPLLAITMGDPAGIGPEVIIRAWCDERVHSWARLIVVGHPEVLRRAAHLLGRHIEVVAIKSPRLQDGAAVGPEIMKCINPCGDEVLDVAPARVDARAGEAAYQAVCRATELALSQETDGIVTAPISKAALRAAGHYYPGHTELLAKMCDVSEFAMMLYLPPGPLVHAPVGLGVAHVTLHQSLRSVFDDLTSDAILSKCRLADQVMRRLGTARPRLAVCALNPHAGESGLFGNEEQTIIRPAVEAAQRVGLDVSGPLPTDTLMVRARDGEFDGVVAMYHDQGHIALKLLGMHAAVNITLGLPIVRTSVAHGTAFDRAWQGTARCEGMIESIHVAAQLAATKA